jgi:hypothetical protein
MHSAKESILMDAHRYSKFAFRTDSKNLIKMNRTPLACAAPRIRSRLTASRI